MSAVLNLLKQDQIPGDEAPVWVENTVQLQAETHPTAVPGVVNTYYFRGVFVEAARHKFAGRPVVTSYDPARWPYPREEAAEKEWDETEE